MPKPVFKYFVEGKRSRSPVSVSTVDNELHNKVSLRKHCSLFCNRYTLRVQFRLHEEKEKDFSAHQRILSYAQSTAQITICVGQNKKQTGLYFKSMYERALKTFNKVVILVGDTVQWHTLQLTNPELSQEEAHQLSIQNGDEWFKSYGTDIDLKKTEVVFWRDWESDTDKYQNMIAKMHDLYLNDKEIYSAINLSVEEFFERTKQKGMFALVSEERCREVSLQYIIEECAIFAFKWHTLNTNYELFPSIRSKALEAVYKRFYGDLNTDLLKPIEVTFMSRNETSPDDSQAHTVSSPML